MTQRLRVDSPFMLAANARGFTPDAAQKRAIVQLERLQAQLAAPAGRGLLARLRGKPAARAHGDGLYLWGGVGRGKTWLMDTFCDSLPEVPRRRAHFHHFMRDVHARLKRLHRQSDPIARLTAMLAGELRLLCLDELYVNDIADAMILARVFQGLLDGGVRLVITSNQPPQSLYRDGLQRERFLPAIALLESRLEVLQMDGGHDYRLRQLRAANIYLPAETPGAADAELARIFSRLSGNETDTGGELVVNGHRLRARRQQGSVIWFDFTTLCEGPRSQNDYIALADEFQTVVLNDVPRMGRANDNAARRFIALVDEFYDRGIKLVLSAAAPPDGLYSGERLQAEFQRTASRLVEMQSEAYLARAPRR